MFDEVMLVQREGEFQAQRQKKFSSIRVGEAGQVKHDSFSQFQLRGCSNIGYFSAMNVFDLVYLIIDRAICVLASSILILVTTAKRHMSEALL